MAAAEVQAERLDGLSSERTADGGGIAMIQGLRTAIYPTPDLARGKEWYRQVLGRDPYFDEPYYVGFAAGGFELGLIPDGEPGAAGVQVFWGVPDAAAELARLAALGAEVHEPVKDVGE